MTGAIVDEPVADAGAGESVKLHLPHWPETLTARLRRNVLAIDGLLHDDIRHFTVAIGENFQLRREGTRVDVEAPPAWFRTPGTCRDCGDAVLDVAAGLHEVFENAKLSRGVVDELHRETERWRRARHSLEAAPTWNLVNDLGRASPELAQAANALRERGFRERLCMHGLHLNHFGRLTRLCVQQVADTDDVDEWPRLVSIFERDGQAVLADHVYDTERVLEDQSAEALTAALVSTLKQQRCRRSD